MYSTFWYVIKHTHGVQKDAEQNFDTNENPIWALNHSLKTFLKSSKPFVLFISDMSLNGSLQVWLTLMNIDPNTVHTYYIHQFFMG